MIYSNSHHPVKVHKIHLKIWKFRDELVSIIEERLKQVGHDTSKVNISDLKKLYRPHTAPASFDSGESEDEDQTEGGEIKELVTQGDNLFVIHRSRPTMEEHQFGDGVVALMDINMDMISCFSSHNYISGQTIIIEFLVPNHFFVTAKVLECRPYNMCTKIISQNRPPYRLHARWLFSLFGERTMLRRFLKSIAEDVPKDESVEIETPEAVPEGDDEKIAA
ncbi:MAG: hypothetical protein OXB88_01610 [Bacteriovoracales bacterium]|nr:hypothetical protein [Bacteriovoracales bacterium]